MAIAGQPPFRDRVAPGGIEARIADALGVPNSSLSFHLAQLHRAGLINQERQHRSLIYSANYASMNALVAYLMENCCAGAECAADAACGVEAAPHAQERKSA